jgi:hypothetical protein
MEIDIDPVDDGFLSYCGVKRRRMDNNIWRTDLNSDTSSLPNHFEAMLADYTLATTPTEIDAALSPVGLVLQLLLVDAGRRYKENWRRSLSLQRNQRGLFGATTR